MTNSSLEDTRALLADVLQIPEEEIKPDRLLSTLGDFDSLSFEKLVLAIEELLRIKISGPDLLKISTVQDLVDLVEKSR